jgi:hypothetical protein
LTEAWPSTLPDRPTVNGFAWRPQDNRLAFAPEVGPSIVRKRSTAAGALATALFNLTDDQVDAFEWWFRKIVNDGVEKFLFKHPRSGALELWSFATGQPYEISALGNGLWSLSCNLLWLPGNRGLAVVDETQAILTALSAPPADAFKVAIDDAVRALIYRGIWSDLDVLQVYASQAHADALINWKAPGTFSATLAGTNVFTAYQGIAGNGTTGYINTGFNPTSAAGKYALNDAHFGLYSRSAGQGATYEAGSVSGATTTFLQTRDGSNQARSRINDGATLTQTGVTDGSGHHGVNRSGASARQYYLRGALAASDTQASVSIPNSAFAVGLWNGTYSAKQISAFHCGRSMTAAKWADMEETLRTFLNAAAAVA